MQRHLRLMPILLMGALLSVAVAAAADVAPRRDAAKAVRTDGPSALQVQKQDPAAPREPAARKSDWQVPPPEDREKKQGGGDRPGGGGGNGNGGGGHHPPPGDHHGHGGWHHFPGLWPGPDFFPYFPYAGLWPWPQVRGSAQRAETRVWDDYDPSLPPGPHLLGRLLGAEIWAADGVFLGVIDPDDKHPDSLFNEAGRYGSFTSPTSLLNPQCPYGAGRGPLSCWDPDTRTPPRLFWNGRCVGVLTTNRALYPRTDPAWVMQRRLNDRRTRN
jgi:hypothetical protein